MALVRLHSGNSLTSLPVYLPDDPAIPAKGVPATASFTRSFVNDHTVLQREQKSAAGWLPPMAYAVILSLALFLLGLVAWGIHRIAVLRGGDPEAPARRKREKTSVHDPMPVT